LPKLLKNVIIKYSFLLNVILASDTKKNEVKRYLWLLVIALAMLSCSKSGKFEIDGKITNSSCTKIYLEKLELNGTTPFDSSKVDQKGNFSFEGKISEPTFFLLRIGEQKFITLLLDSMEKVKFSADYINFSNDYKIEGSLGSLKVKELYLQLTRTNAKIDSINSLINLSVNQPDFEQKRNDWYGKINHIKSEQQEFSKKFVTNNPFSLASIMAIYQRFNSGEYIIQDLQTIKVAASALNSMYPNSVHANTLYEDTKKLIQDVENQKVKKFIEEKGENSPDITLPNQSGEKISLSSLRGKYVLVQFWSANDASSRIISPVLKENYQKFKSRGFEIYQVSIDTSRNDWIQAVQKDQLNWINVGDMQGSKTALISYNIQQIPYNYLLNKDGQIIAKNLKGPALYKILNEIFN
jgi:peroxiredoxin